MDKVRSQRNKKNTGGYGVQGTHPVKNKRKQHEKSRGKTEEMAGGKAAGVKRKRRGIHDGRSEP